MSVAVTTVRLNGSSFLLYHHLSQCWLNKIIKAFCRKSDPSRCSIGSIILPLCWVRTAPDVSVEEAKYASPFFCRWVFSKVCVSCPLLLVALPGLIDTLLQSCQLEGFSMNDMEINDLGTEMFPQHTIADLNTENTFIVTFIQEQPLRWKEINTDTHVSNKSCK